MGYKEIYARYRQQIQDGLLKPGARVPSIRSLASELQVARKTVETAYEILTGEGYLISLGAKGTYINPELRLTSTVSADNTVSSRSPNTPVTERKGDLRLGIPALDEFPHKKMVTHIGKGGAESSSGRNAHAPGHGLSAAT